MENLPYGSESFKPIDPTKPILVARDLFPLYFRSANGDEYHSVILADSAVFQAWISQYIRIEFAPGASMMWAYDERLEVIKACIGLGEFDRVIYMKEGFTDVAEV